MAAIRDALSRDYLSLPVNSVEDDNINSQKKSTTTRARRHSFSPLKKLTGDAPCILSILTEPSQNVGVFVGNGRNNFFNW
jgi:hypothetical protein